MVGRIPDSIPTESPSDPVIVTDANFAGKPQKTSARPLQKSNIRSAYLWTVLGSTVRYIAAFGISIVLARILKPEDYGLLGMVGVFVELLGTVFDWSLGQAVVHFREEHPEQQRPTYFSISVFFGLSLNAILYLAAPLVAEFYREPRLTILLRVMSFSLTIISVKTVSISILVRELRFRELQSIDILSSTISGIAAIVMAYLGFGVWSLVANLFLFMTLQAILYNIKVPLRLTLNMNREILRHLWRYCAPLIGSGSLAKFYDNADYLVIGRVLGPSSLGFYAVAFRLAMQANERISSVINRVAFPVFVGLKDNPPELIRHWFAVTKRVALITFPLLVWLALNAEDFVRVVLGARWLEAKVPLQFLCVMTAVKILTNVVYRLVQGIGFPALSLRYDVLTATVLPLGFLIGAKTGGLVGVGIAWCTVFPILRLLFLIGVKRAFPFSLTAYAKNLFDPFWVAAVCGILMAPTAWLLPSGLIRLCLSTVLWAAGIVLCVAVSSEVRGMLMDTLSIFEKKKLQQ